MALRQARPQLFLSEHQLLLLHCISSSSSSIYCCSTATPKAPELQYSNSIAAAPGSRCSGNGCCNTGAAAAPAAAAAQH
ncbi:hypothetical protein ACSSS7_005533 [Eimeria intestinalis]